MQGTGRRSLRHSSRSEPAKAEDQKMIQQIDIL